MYKERDILKSEHESLKKKTDDLDVSDTRISPLRVQCKRSVCNPVSLMNVMLKDGWISLISLKHLQVNVAHHHEIAPKDKIQ